MLSDIRENKLIKAIKDTLSHRYFPFVTALIVTGCYYLELDLFTFYYLGLTGIAMVILLDNLAPLISNFLFLNVAISYSHSPSPFGGVAASDYLFQPAVLSQLIVIIILYVAAVFLRIALTVKWGKFKVTPEFYGLCALSAVFILNGVFSTGYNPMNMVYGVFMAFCFLGIYSLMKDNVSCDEKTFEDIAYAFLAFSVVLIFELLIKYATCNVISDGKINRNLLGFGWGMYNNMGMLMMLCLPSLMYLAEKHKYGYLFFIYAIVHCVATVMTMSRQAIVCVTVIFSVCLVILLVKGRNKLINSIIAGICAVLLIVFLCVFWDKFIKLFGMLLQGNLATGNGRKTLWTQAWENFLSSPVTGKGFYVDLANDPGFAGMSIIPDMYHNTFFQLLGSCGILGLAAYAFHRVQTVISFFKDVTLPRTYIALTILALLIVNLLDNHLFYILPTIVYGSLLAVLIKSRSDRKRPEQKEKRTESETPSTVTTDNID